MRAMGPTCTLTRTHGSTFARDVVQAQGPVLLVVPDGSCGTCRIGFGEPFAGSRVRCYCLDETGAGELAGAYGVSHRPTLLLLRAGKVVRRLVGAPLPDVIDTILRTEASLGGRRP
jgi:hypothetical protein